MFADPKDEHASYEALMETKQTVTAKDSLELSMRIAGGAAVYFEPADGPLSAPESSRSRPR
ncbi:MAG: hypothetical protein ACR2JE_07020 [Acidobacteriaceae bacterium]